MSITSILQVDNIRDPVLRALRARADRQHHQPRHPLQQVGGEPGADSPDFYILVWQGANFRLLSSHVTALFDANCQLHQTIRNPQ